MIMMLSDRLLYKLLQRGKSLLGLRQVARLQSLSHRRKRRRQCMTLGPAGNELFEIIERGLCSAEIATLQGLTELLEISTNAPGPEELVWEVSKKLPAKLLIPEIEAAIDYLPTLLRSARTARVSILRAQ
jgi:hypothetical protein